MSAVFIGILRNADLASFCGAAWLLIPLFHESGDNVSGRFLNIYIYIFGDIYIYIYIFGEQHVDENKNLKIAARLESEARTETFFIVGQHWIF
jgi:hypothetical protein